MSAISIVVLCSVFSNPALYLSETRQAEVCNMLPTVLSEARQNDLDPFLLMGLITVESNWKTTAVSWADACGLTQVIPKWTGGKATKGVKYTCEDLKQPKVGIEAGARILSWWINSYGKGNIPVGLCGYFSGFRCKPVIHQKGKNYYLKVLKNSKKLKKMYLTELNSNDAKN